MRIGVDISSLQGGSRMRGIGYSLINIINSLTPEEKAKHSFVFYMNRQGQFDPLELIDTVEMDFATAYLETFKPIKHWPGPFRIASKLINKFLLARHQWFGGAHFKNVRGIDVFFQIDQASGLPPRWKARSVLFLHDVIPYVFEREYLFSYRTALERGLGRKGALGAYVARVSYAIKVKLVLRRASMLLANSEWTKQDYVSLFNVKPKKIRVVALGVNKSNKVAKKEDDLLFNQACPTPWGYAHKPVSLRDKPFLLFIGGADPRRRLIDMVAAFNNLRAQGADLRLAFAGDSMQSPDTIGSPSLQTYLKKHTAYTDDVAFLGFVTDDQRDWLYDNALAYVFPSVYEGFGLPILEAMERGCPVITYLNTSITEVAGNAALPAQDFDDIVRHTANLIADKNLRQNLIKRGRKQAAKYSWRKTAEEVLDALARTA